MSSSSALASSTTGPSPASVPPAFDFVSSDFDALSSHMAHCSAAHGQWSALKGGLQWVHAVVSGRIVTMAFIATVTAVALATFA